MKQSKSLSLNTKNVHSLNKQNSGFVTYERLSPPGVSLTRREAECLYFLSLGNSLQKISTIFQRSVRTIEMHIQNIRVKMGYESKSELVEKAISLHIAMLLEKSMG